MKTIKNIFAQEKRIIDAINKEGQTLINTTSFEEWDNIEDRLEQIIKRRRRVFNIARALRAVQMGIQPYLQQRSPHLLLHHDGTQDHPTEKRDDPEMGSQCKRQV